MPQRTRRILLLMHQWAGYVHGVQMGIADYFVLRPHWIWNRWQPRRETLDLIAQVELDGAICHIEPDYLADLKRLKIPVVDISNWMPKSPFPRVVPDDRAIGRLAARHLMDLGLRHFGVVGPFGALFADLRRSAFEAELAKEDLRAQAPSAADRMPKGATAPPGIAPSLAAWLLQLPKPAGIFGVFDSPAADTLEACRHLGIKVPEEVCVLGVDNDELATRLSHPPLSSINLPAGKIGFEAARLLDSLMAGEAPPPEPICLPPLGVVARQSTNLLAIPDEDVLSAMRYIREHVHEGVTVKQLLHEVPVNRRYLERRFKQHLGRTPLQEIRHARLERARALLAESDLSMPAVARHSGFPNAERFANVFRQEVGVTPTAYRRRFRLQDH